MLSLEEERIKMDLYVIQGVDEVIVPQDRLYKNTKQHIHRQKNHKQNRKTARSASLYTTIKGLIIGTGLWTLVNKLRVGRVKYSYIDNRGRRVYVDKKAHLIIPKIVLSIVDTIVGIFVLIIFMIIFAVILYIALLFYFPGYTETYTCSALNCETSRDVFSTHNGNYIAGAKGDIKYLENNPCATDPTYTELINFLVNDNTDRIPYDFENFVCADFAERVHNNAESNGIRAAYVIIDEKRLNGHALNAFNTVDKGLIYVDCTGFLDRPDLQADKFVRLEIGEYPYMELICPSSYHHEVDNSIHLIGRVKNIEVIW